MYQRGVRFKVLESTTMRSENLQRYKYNGKELDRMHGLNLYDYGARQYDAAAILFTSMDSKCENYYHISPYVYCMGNSVNAIDSDGRLVIFINGFHWGWEGASSSYWNGFDKKITNHFKDEKTPLYYDGSLGGVLGLSLIQGNQITYTLHSQPFTSSNLSVGTRYNAGLEQGRSSSSSSSAILESLDRDKNGKIKEVVRIITHSMGSAYAKGFAQALMDYVNNHQNYCKGVNIVEYDFAPFQPNAQKAVDGVDTYQYSHHFDKVAKDGKVEGAHYYTSYDENKGHTIKDFFDYITQLPFGAEILLKTKVDKNEE